MNKIAIRTYSSVNDPRYEEAEALNALQFALNRAVKIETALSDESGDNEFPQQFMISIAGLSIAFYTGAPQIDALRAFIKTLAEDNMYSKDEEGRWTY